MRDEYAARILAIDAALVVLRANTKKKGTRKTRTPETDPAAGVPDWSTRSGGQGIRLGDGG